MTYDQWHMINDTWSMKHDQRIMINETWSMTSMTHDQGLMMMITTGSMTHDQWHMIYGILSISHDQWHVNNESWLMTHDWCILINASKNHD